jgi:hypothetical protein
LVKQPIMFSTSVRLRLATTEASNRSCWPVTRWTSTPKTASMVMNTVVRSRRANARSWPDSAGDSSTETGSGLAWGAPSGRSGSWMGSWRASGAPDRASFHQAMGEGHRGDHRGVGIVRWGAGLVLPTGTGRHHQASVRQVLAEPVQQPWRGHPSGQDHLHHRRTSWRE